MVRWWEGLLSLSAASLDLLATLIWPSQSTMTLTPSELCFLFETMATAC